jgi:hypothetical protein
MLLQDPKIAKRPEVWVKLDGVLAETGDVPSTWAIGPKTAHAEEVLEFANQFGDVIVYGMPLFHPRGHRRVQRWLSAEDLSRLVFWTSHEQTPPHGVEVIDQWPMNSNKFSTADSPPTAPSNSPPATG